MSVKAKMIDGPADGRTITLADDFIPEYRVPDDVDGDKWSVYKRLRVANCIEVLVWADSPDLTVHFVENEGPPYSMPLVAFMVAGEHVAAFSVSEEAREDDSPLRNYVEQRLKDYLA